MKTLGSSSSSSAKASFSASLTVYVFAESAYPLIDVKAGGVILWMRDWYAHGLCESSREAGLNNLETDILQVSVSLPQISLSDRGRIKRWDKLIATKEWVLVREDAATTSVLLEVVERQRDWMKSDTARW